jgi:hypothetical protein
MTTLAEDLALLLVDPATGKPVVDRTALDRGIAGAVLLDLVDAGRVTVRGSGAGARVATTGNRAGSPLLDAAVERLGTKERRAASAVERLSSTMRAATFDQLVSAGIVVGEPGRILGLFPTTTWRFTKPEVRSELQAGVAGVLTGKGEPDERQAALVSLLYAVKAEHKLVDGPRRELRARAKEIADGEWAGSAVSQAVRAVQATIAAAIVASTAAGSAASSG